MTFHCLHTLAHTLRNNFAYIHILCHIYYLFDKSHPVNNQAVDIVLEQKIFQHDDSALHLIFFTNLLQVKYTFNLLVTKIFNLQSG